MVIIDPNELSPLSGCDVVFRNISVNIKDKPILQNVSGVAKAGEVLAIMGPSGSGKTTLLNTIAGRQNDLESGTIMLNNQKLTKRLRRRVSYVLQEDIFFDNITLIDTLKSFLKHNQHDTFQSFLKHNQHDTFQSFLKHNQHDTFQSFLKHNQHGTFQSFLKHNNHDTFQSFLKHNNHDTFQSFLKHNNHDTDGLIGNAENKGLSGGEKKRANIACELLTDPVVLLLDEPTTGLDSSIAYSLIWSLKQYTAYFGHVKNIMDYFSRIGLTCVEHYNPADFVMEKLKGTEDEIRCIKEEGKKASWDLLEDIKQTNPLTDSLSQGKNIDSINIDIIPDEEVLDSKKKKWPTNFLEQYRILTVRCFKQAKSTILTKSNYIECIMVSIMFSLIWWQLGFEEEDIISRMGLFVFYLVYWCFAIALIAVIVFPSEKIVMFKERSAGMYRLSAFYLSKNTSELPLLIILPIISTLIVYWSTGLNQSASAFFSFMALLLLTVFAGQALGQAISIAWLDFEKSLSTTAIIILFSLMLSGFYIDDFPVWLEWTKYTSFLYYSYNALLIIEFTDNGPFRCTLDYSIYEECQNNSTYISSSSILQEANVHLPLWLNYLFLVVYMLTFKILGYVILRFWRKPTF
uniref:ABC transporter G family member 14-like n=1 Tax=Saccoglossus kowalevskii TaxID=10224 RepID=A0ABM0MDB5_SACKO|nr:PREDICTED: ABC transporter G family member 14-like [Saccoglossus kowalevskii]